MKYKLLVLDVDGTLLNDAKEISKRTLAALLKVQQMGVSGWIGSRRVLLGSRDHMKSHGITVPDSKKETALNKKNDEVIYLAVAGEVCMLFFVTLTANPQVKHQVQTHRPHQDRCSTANSSFHFSCRWWQSRPSASPSVWRTP